MNRSLVGVLVLLLATLCLAGRSGAQSEQESASVPAPETTPTAPSTEAVPRSIPGIIWLTPPAPRSQTQPQTCPFTGQKLELIG
jgi:hypothetical protein